MHTCYHHPQRAYYACTHRRTAGTGTSFSSSWCALRPEWGGCRRGDWTGWVGAVSVHDKLLSTSLGTTLHCAACCCWNKKTSFPFRVVQATKSRQSDAYGGVREKRGGKFRAETSFSFQRLVRVLIDSRLCCWCCFWQIRKPGREKERAATVVCLKLAVTAVITITERCLIWSIWNLTRGWRKRNVCTWWGQNLFFGKDSGWEFAFINMCLREWQMTSFVLT